MRKTPALLLACWLGAISHAQEQKSVDALPACARMLREAASKKSPAPGELHSLTRNCIALGHAADANAVLLHAHDQATNTTAKVVMMPLLTWCAYASGTSEALIKEFTARRDAQPESALAWLELALACDHANWGLRLDSLKRAAALSPDDAETVDLLAGHLESEKLWQEALQTVERGARLFESPSLITRNTILHLLVGDDLRGWGLAKRDASGLFGSAEALQEIGEVGCELREWDKVEALAREGLTAFADDLGAQCLRAVALEEMGRDAESVQAFLKILQTKDSSTPPTFRFSGVAHEAGNWRENQSTKPNLPDGVAALDLVGKWSFLACVHSRNAEWHYGMRSFRHPLKLHLPGSVADARAFALAHLEELARCGASVPPQAVKAALAETGNGKLALLSELRGRHPSPVALGEAIMRQHPEDKVLVAWWLRSREHWTNPEPGEVPLLEHGVRLFAESHPGLAFNSALRLATYPNPRQEEYQKKALELFHKFAEREPDLARREAYSFAERSRTWANASEWRAAAVPVLERGARELPEAWEQKGDDPTLGVSRYECALGLLKHLAASGRWEDFAASLNAEMLRKLPVEWLIQQNPYGSYGQGSLLLSDYAALSFPGIALRWPGSVTGALEYEVYHRTRDGTLAQMDKSWIEKIDDPALGIYAHWKLGDASKARELIEKRIKSPEAGLGDWWLAAWMAWSGRSDFPEAASEQRAALLSAERLARAAEFPATGALRTYLDAALLRTVLALHKRPNAMIEAAHKAATRLCQSPLPTSYDRDDLAAAFQYLGFSAELAVIGKVKNVPHPSDSIVRIVDIPSTSTTLERYRSHRAPTVTWGKPSNEKDKATTVRRALQTLHHQFPDELTWSGGHLRGEWERAGLLEAVLAAAVPPATATARRLLRAGQDFELLGDKESARTYYEAALRAAPKLHDAQSRLAVLRAEKTPAASITDLESLPENEVPRVLEMLGAAASPAKAQVASEWMQRLANAGGELPANAVMPIQQMILNQDPPADDLCRAALAFRELAADALGRLGGEAIKRKELLNTVAPLAKAHLAAQAKWRQEQERSVSHIVSRSEALPREERISLPSAAVILIWDAWQRNAPQELESTILPLLRPAGEPSAEVARLGAELFFCAPDQFIGAARRFLINETRESVRYNRAERFFEGTTLDFILVVWRVRQLQVSLEELIFQEIERATKQDSGNRLPSLTTWIVLSKPGPQKAEALVRKARDLLLSPNAEKRRLLIDSTRERSRHAPIPWRWSRQLPTPRGTWHYVTWLQELDRQPELRDVARNLAKEDALKLQD
jgi:hypothetical protein